MVTLYDGGLTLRYFKLFKKGHQHNGHFMLQGEGPT